MRKRKQRNPKFQTGDKVNCQTIDLWGRRLTVKSIRWNSGLGYHEYVLEDENGVEIRRNVQLGVPDYWLPEHFLTSAEGILEKFIRLSQSSGGEFNE